MLHHRVPPIPDRRWFKLASFLLLTLFAAAGVLAQTARIELQVSDASGKKKLADVRVTATDANGAVVASGTTSKKGKLELSVQQAGMYKIKLEKEGLGTKVIDVKLATAMTTTAKINMVDQATMDKQVAVEAFNQAVVAIESQEADAALELFTKATELDPSLTDAHRLVALLQAERGNLDEAGAALERFLELNPAGLTQAAPAAYEVYRKAGKTDQLPEIREQLRALGAHSDYAIKVYNEGVAEVKADNKDAALALFTEAVTLDPELATAYRSMAALHFNDKEYEQAEPYLKKLIELQPRHVEGHRLLFFSQFEQGKASAATTTAKAWQGINGKAATDILEQVEKHFEANQTDTAKKMTEIVLAVDGAQGEAHYAMGRILAQQGSIPQAKEHLQKFLDLSPNHPEAEAARQMLAAL